MGEAISFKLTGEETFNAKLFRIHHKRQGCKLRGLLGNVRREVQKIEPTYSYVFEQQSSSGEFRKYIRCNNCQEQIEITAKERKVLSKS